MTLQEAMDIASNVTDPDKKHKPMVKLFDKTTYPLQENTDFDLWNNIVFIDLDLNKVEAFDQWMVSNYGSLRVFRQTLIDAFTKLFPNNFYAFEHSSSGIGVHALFYYDVEKTMDNHKRCAIHTKNIILNNIDTYMPGFKDILLMDGVFDSIYKRPFQNCFITGNSHYIRKNDLTGEVDLSDVTYVTPDNIEPMGDSYYIKDIDFSTIKPETLIKAGYNVRFPLATALKSVTVDETEWSEKLYAIFQLIEKYRRSSTARQMMREIRYAGCKEDSLPKNAKISILKRFGIEVDRKKTLHRLDYNEFLGDVIDKVLEEIEPGISLLQAGTGVGKTRTWTDLNDRILANPMEMNFHKSILIIEPYNSIIENKYDRSKINLIIKDTPFPRNICSYGMYVTNFNKLLSMDEEGWTSKSDWRSFFNQFELVVVDESHIAIKDAFRKDVLAPFIKMMKEVGKEGITKIILQTATPMDEDRVFDLNSHIIIEKPSTKQREVIFRSSTCRTSDPKDYNLEELTSLVRHYRNKGRKVYIYWSNGSLQKMKRFRDLYEDPAKVAIYHKSNSGNEDYEYIATEKKLGDRYDILISSIYFGVGNDLNDTDKAAVIIIGNHSAQEDIQAIGRFRNSNDVNTCIILTQKDMQTVAATSGNVMSRDACIKDAMTALNAIMYNVAIKDKAVTLNGVKYGIREDCINELAIIESSNYYYSTWVEKMKMLKNPYYGLTVIEKIEPIRCDWDFNEKIKMWDKALKKIRDERIRKIIAEEYDFEGGEFQEIIKSDTRIHDFYYAWKRMKATGIVDGIDPDWLVKASSVDVITRWFQLFKRVNNRKSDWPEILSLLWFRRMIDMETEKEKELAGVRLKAQDYWTILAYTIWVSKCNADETIKGASIVNAFKEYRRMTDAVSKMPALMIDAFYKTETVEERYQGNVLWEFLGFDAIAGMPGEIVIHSLEDIQALTADNGIDGMEIANQCIQKFMADDATELRGSLGGRPSKKLIVTDKFNAKKMVGYHLNVGDVFMSASLLATKCGVGNQVITKWLKKGWLMEQD